MILRKTIKDKLNEVCLEIYIIEDSTNLDIALFLSKVSAGIPEALGDFEYLKIDLKKYLIDNPISTFYVRVKGNFMDGTRIEDGDLLIVDKAPNPKNNDLAVCVINGEFAIMRISEKNNEVYLIPKDFGTGTGLIKVQEEGNAYVWGIITYIIHKT